MALSRTQKKATRAEPLLGNRTGGRLALARVPGAKCPVDRDADENADHAAAR
jgi:uncharacterized protein YhaN